jgi:hypothetical protein
MRWVGHATHMGKMRNSNKIFVEKPEGKKPLGTLKYTYKGDIKINLIQIE